LLDGLIAALLALAALVAATGGFEIEAGSLTLRSHSAWRVLAIALIPLGFRLWTWDKHAGSGFRIAMLSLIFLSIGYWFKYLLSTVGGADSYGYASAARMLASGRLIEPAPLAEWLSSPNRFALTSPLGWAPAAGGGISPTYPLGLPALMAIFSIGGGSNAVYFVSPVMALLTLWLVFRLTRNWSDADTALLATALVAWNPVFLTYAKQPMSDMPATAWLLLAFYLISYSQEGGAATRRSALAGVAAGAAFLTRPALLFAVALIPLLARRGPKPFQRMLLAAAGIAVAAGIRLAVQAYMFGNPFSTGYGAPEALFSWEALPENVDIYARHSWRALGPLWLVAVGAGAWVMRGPRAAAILAIAAAVTLPYLFYIRFDHWETLRFLLPGLVPVTILAAAGVTTIARSIRVPAVATIVVMLFAGAFALRSERLMRESSVWDIQNLEARYPLVGQWFQVNTPPTSVAIAGQHSGSLRWYGGRETIRWDVLRPEELVPAVRELESHGATVYAVLEGTEQQRFDEKFAKELARLSIDPVGRIRNVSFLRLTSGALPPS
jgi:4-amino-4-deoxy-L-arabinose transferase-like glycosyltransferase